MVFSHRERVFRAEKEACTNSLSRERFETILYERRVCTLWKYCRECIGNRSDFRVKAFTGKEVVSMGPNDRASAGKVPRGIKNQERLIDLIRLGIETAEVKDIDVLMERILRSAREFVGCDAGSIYIKNEDTLQFSFAQNDTLAALLAPGEKLIYHVFTMPVSCSSIAGRVAVTGAVLSIPDAYDLAEDAPYRFDRSFDEMSGYRTRSILAVPLKTHAGKTVGVLQLINALNAEGEVIPFDRSIEPYVEYFAANAATGLERAQLTRAVILRMIGMAELRDPLETGNHVNRVAGYAAEIYETWARKRGMGANEIERKRDILRMAAMLHDVGKVAISDLILKKPGRLDREEYEIMKQHTLVGARLFGDVSSEFDEAAREVALTHHERFDGTGYPGFVNPDTGAPIPGHIGPSGNPLPMKGSEIPLFGRIVAVADVYDALSSPRCYKEMWSEERVLDELRKGSGAQFDPEMIEAFFTCLPTLRSVGERYR
jgi:HD-GYP domain-containing protein (c-di-GMP phosphodiesterase class II)